LKIINIPGNEEIMKNNKQEEVLEDARKQLKDILDGSTQAIYVYLDDTHTICNQRFASLLGYGTAQEWEHVDMPFAETFVADQSQEALVFAYRNAVHQKIGATLDVTWKKKSGGQVITRVILVPISYENALLALHFITEK
jgi:PAS domain-containing protein